MSLRWLAGEEEEEAEGDGRRLYLGLDRGVLGLSANSGGTVASIGSVSSPSSMGSSFEPSIEGVLGER
jgi:hypothetical protein